jgi:6-phosphogluconolactonase
MAATDQRDAIMRTNIGGETMKRWPMIVLGLAVALAGSVAPATRSAACRGSACAGTLVYVGTHGSGPGEGIFAARLDPRHGTLIGRGLVAAIDRPTWLVADQPQHRLYSVSETGNDGRSNGSVYGFAVARGSGALRQLGRADAAGGGTTHLALDREARMLFAANYGAGQVVAIALDAVGAPTRVQSMIQHEGNGPGKRQQGPHAHGVTLDPSGRYVLSPDLGADKVFIHRFDRAAGTLSTGAQDAIDLPPGSGPRHLVFSPGGQFAFVDTELTGAVYVFRWNAARGTATPVMNVALDPVDFTGQRSAAELVVSRDGRFLYVSNRGDNTVQVFSIDQRTGALRSIQRIDAGGKSPWSVALDPSDRWLIVANEATNNLAVFARHQESGRLDHTGQSLSIPQPTALAFFR